MSRTRNFNEDDYYDEEEFGEYGEDGGYDYAFGSLPDSNFSHSFENRYVFENRSHNLSDYITPEPSEHQFPENEEDEKKEVIPCDPKKLKECMNFLKANGHDMETRKVLEMISKRNNCQKKKALSDMNVYSRDGIGIPPEKVEKKKQKKHVTSLTNLNENKTTISSNGGGKKKKKKKRKNRRKKNNDPSNTSNQNQNERSSRPRKIEIPFNPQTQQPVDLITQEDDRSAHPSKIIETQKRESNIITLKTPIPNVEEPSSSFPPFQEPKPLKPQKKKEEESQIQKSPPPVFIEDQSRKKHLNVVVIGHVDAGKSTLLGHLLYQLKGVSQKQIHKFKKESNEVGKRSFYFAWVMDSSEEERNHGVTINIGVRQFQTKKSIVTLLDAPGHRDFIPNMIMGASQGDVAILVVDTVKGAFESGFRSGGQTREHALLVKCLGIRKLIVVVNKMDMCEYKEERYRSIVGEVGNYLTQKVGFKKKNVIFVPASGLKGENLVSFPSENKLFEWYKEKKSVIDIIDGLNPLKRNIGMPFRMSIMDVYRGDYTGIIVCGTIDSGFLKKGDKVKVFPIQQEENQTVKKIIKNRVIIGEDKNENEKEDFYYGDNVDDSEDVEKAYAGEYVEIQLAGIDFERLHPGQILSDPIYPVKYCKKFRAIIVVFEIDFPIIRGTEVILHVQNVNVPGHISKLNHILDKKQKSIKKRPRLLKKNTHADVLIRTDDFIGLELFEVSRSYGRFVLRKEGKTIASGIVKKTFQK